MVLAKGLPNPGAGSERTGTTSPASPGEIARRFAAWYREQGEEHRKAYARTVAAEDAGEALGPCLETALFACALLRAAGCGPTDVFVAVGCAVGEDIGQALHAAVVCRDGSDILFMDLDNPDMSRTVTSVPDFSFLADRISMVCMFNDSIGVVAPTRWPD